MPQKNSPDHIEETSAEDSAEKKKCDQAISEYTYTVSHSLNAPLRHIIQYGDLLKDEVGSRLGADGSMYVNKLIISTKRLQRLVNDLLAYAHILHFKEEKQWMDLNKIAAEVIEGMTVLIEESHATINIGNLPAIYVYPFRMRQLFHCLIDNAIKYRSTKDPVINIECIDESRRYLFSFRDNSIGVPHEHYKSVFKALKRLHSQDDINGSGLGLAICEKAVEAHGGQIWVESLPEEGSVFFFTIPKQSAH